MAIAATVYCPELYISWATWSDQFDRSIADFAKRYADQNELDYQAFSAAIRSGRLEALQGV